VAVIDTGRVKETSFDPQSNMVKLEEVWASKAACKQRRGRAGRVRAGKCYKLFTRNAEDRMAERPLPEIRRTPLEQLCLAVKAMGISDVPSFLSNALTAPDSFAVEGAIGLLSRMGALEDGKLTALGRHLAMIPADLRCSKLLVYGTIFGCLEPCLTIAAALTVRSPFVSPQGKRDEAKAIKATFGQGYGDLIADLRAYEQYLNLRQKVSHKDMRMWCEDSFLSVNTLNDITSNRSQYLSSLKEIGLVPLTYASSTSSSSPLNAHASSTALTTALIAASFYPQSARIQFPEKKYTATSTGAIAQDPEARTIKYFIPTPSEERDERVFMHPSSTLFDAQSFPGNACFMSYFEKVATTKVFIRNVTPYNAYTALMFCGSIMLDTMGRGLVLDEDTRLRGWARIGALVNRLRILLDEVLAKKIEDPALDVSGNDVVAAVRKLVEFDGLDR
jgi:HrpA-like RNA helicase